MRSGRGFRMLEGGVALLAIACGYGCLGLSFLIGFEILARKLANYSLQGVDELGGYVLAVTAAIGFAYALIHRVHTRIDLGITALRPPGRAILNAFAAVLLAGYTCFMAFRAWGALAESLEFGSRASTPLQTPLWIPQSLWLLGIVTFAVVSVAMAFDALLLLWRDRDTLNSRYGPPSLDEEIEASMNEAERHAGSTPARVLQ